MFRTLVLALGNELRGDDGIGPAVIQRLRSLHSPHTGVEWMDGGMKDLSSILTRQDIDRLIIVDAADLDLSPGEWRRLDLTRQAVEILDGIELNHMHGLSLSQALALGGVLGTLPQEIVLYAVQPEQVEYRRGLSETVYLSVMEVCEAIQNELELTPHGKNGTNFEFTTRSGLTETRV